MERERLSFAGTEGGTPAASDQVRRACPRAWVTLSRNALVGAPAGPIPPRASSAVHGIPVSTPRGHPPPTRPCLGRGGCRASAPGGGRPSSSSARERAQLGSGTPGPQTHWPRRTHSALPRGCLGALWQGAGEESQAGRWDLGQHQTMGSQL